MALEHEIAWTIVFVLRISVASTVKAVSNDLYHQGHKRTFNIVKYCKDPPPEGNCCMTANIVRI